MKLQRKSQEIQVLQSECKKYYDQCNDLDFIKQLIKQGHEIGGKEIKLDKKQMIKMRQVMDKLEIYSKSQSYSNDIDFIANKLKIQCDSLGLSYTKK